jgi:hypothetical protein
MQPGMGCCQAFGPAPGWLGPRLLPICCCIALRHGERSFWRGGGHKMARPAPSGSWAVRAPLLGPCAQALPLAPGTLR